MTIEEKLAHMGLVLPKRMEHKFSFVPVRIVDNIAYVSGHGAQNPDGTLAEPLGKVGVDLTVEEGNAVAKGVALSILGSLKLALGDLERVKYWVKLLGMVNCAPDFTQQPSVINGASDLILELYGKERGSHARSAVGMSSLPMGMAVEIEAIVVIE